LIAAGWIAYSFLAVQPISVTVGDRSTEIDLRSLGEYQANLQRLRLSDPATGQVLWEIAAPIKSIVPVWVLSLKQGRNPSQPPQVLPVQVLTPPADTFCLQADHAYLLETWSFRDLGLSHRKTRLQVPPTQEPPCAPQVTR